MSVTGLTIQHTSKWFQQSNDTISKYFHHMLGIFSTGPFYTTNINLPNAHTPLSQRICNNPKMSPFFDHALGTLDGCHITCAPPSYSHPPYRNWKGFISQNCLFTCDFDLQFVFCYTRWEGSATDAQVLEGRLQARLEIPNGYYYLADVGYPPLNQHLLTSYHGVPSCQVEQG